MVVSNILDPVHDTLDPTVWDSVHEHFPVLKPQHKTWILDTVLDTLKRHGYGDMDKWLEIYFTGSLTTFQYSKDSDADVSLFVNTDVFPEWSRAEMIGVMVSDVDGTTLPGTTHPMQCFVVAKGIRPQDLYKPGLRSGYLIEADQWAVPPERDRVHDVQREQVADYQHALEQADKMERLLRYEPQKAVKFWHQIHNRRREDMKQGKGDFSQSNIIYKFLSNRGLFPQISEVSGEYIAKTAAPGNVAKFVYDPRSDTLVLGQMGMEEGENLSHAQLAQDFLGEPHKDLIFGQIGDNGYASTFPRRMIGDSQVNPYEAQYRAEQSVCRAVPGAQFTNPAQLLRPEWGQGDTTVLYAGTPPTLQVSNEPFQEPSWEDFFSEAAHTGRAPSEEAWTLR